MGKDNILLTGGAGYIGSHTCVSLMNSGYNVIIFDNLVNSDIATVDAIKQITGRHVSFIKGDIMNVKDLQKVFSEFKIFAVIHFAGFKSVDESVIDPIGYYENNIQGSINLIKVMQANNVTKIIFSSSATVYGEPQTLPITEKHPLLPVTPYGKTKLYIEELLNDLYKSNPTWSIGILRYFNPTGAHSSGLIGENPKGKPSNL